MGLNSSWGIPFKVRERILIKIVLNGKRSNRCKKQQIRICPGSSVVEDPEREGTFCSSAHEGLAVEARPMVRLQSGGL